jgi:tetratricopeptide (TPR) repeat protein
MRGSPLGLLLLLAPSLALGDPWTVRPDPVARSNQLLQLLDESPDSEEGLKALIDGVGIARALQLAGARSARTRSWQAHFVDGRLWSRRARHERAEASFQTALGVGGKAPRLLGWIGEELVRAGRVARAEAFLRSWLPRRGDDAGALGLSVRIALSRRDAASALKAQKRLCELQPSNLQVRIVHARLLRERGAIDEAEKEFEVALKLLARPEKDALKDAALECQILLEQGALLELLERFDEAVKRYRRGLTLAAKGRWAHHELQSRILKSFEKRSAFSELEQEARAMLKADAKNTLALRVLAERSVKARKPTDAIGFYLRYVKLVPTDSSARAELLFLLSRAGRNREAVEHARELWQRNPSLPRNLLEYGTTLAAAGEKAKAIQILRAGIPRFQKDADGLQLIASGLDGLGDAEGVKLSFAAMIRIEGANKEHTRAWGSYLWGKGRRADAVKSWSALLGASPSRLDYERWVEVILEENVLRERSFQSMLTEEIKRGLGKYPGHRGLISLARQLGL